MSNPQRVDLSERKFVGIPRRAAILIGLALGAGFLLIITLPANLLLKLVVGVGVALGGITLAFLKIDGLNPEHWLLESLSFKRRVRHRIKGFKAVTAEPRAPAQVQAQPPAPTPKAAPQAKPVAAPRAPRAAQPTLVEVPAALLSALVTLFCVLLLTGLALYLNTGGAEHVVVLLRNLS
jgi:hypothetical protein